MMELYTKFCFDNKIVPKYKLGEEVYFSTDVENESVYIVYAYKIYSNRFEYCITRNGSYNTVDEIELKR